MEKTSSEIETVNQKNYKIRFFFGPKHANSQNFICYKNLPSFLWLENSPLLTFILGEPVYIWIGSFGIGCRIQWAR